MLADAFALPSDAVRRILTAEDLARIDSYRGGAVDLHDLLPSVLPLTAPRYYETTVTAQHGTMITMGYYAAPHLDGLAIAFAASALGGVMGPIGPVIVTPTEIRRPIAMSDEQWREIRSATGIALRALLLGL